MLKKILYFVLAAVAGLIVFRWWESRPVPEPPELIWTRQPFRGPEAYAEPAKVQLPYTFVPLSGDPPLESIEQAAPGERAFVRSTSSWGTELGESLSFRKPFTKLEKMTPSEQAAWTVRFYTFTGATETVGSRRWAQYRRDAAQPAAPGAK